MGKQACVHLLYAIVSMSETDGLYSVSIRKQLNKLLVACVNNLSLRVFSTSKPVVS